MRVLAVFAHPSHSSLCWSILQRALAALKARQHEVLVQDLYAMQFDPLLRSRQALPLGSCAASTQQILESRAHLDWADGLLFVYPIWWSDRPAILKGWFDCCLCWDRAIKMEPRGHSGLLGHKRAIILQTCAQSLERATAQGSQELMHGCVEDGTLQLCGVQVDRIETFYQISSRRPPPIEEIFQKVDAAIELWPNPSLPVS